MSKGSCGFCPPNLDSFPERDRKALGGVVVVEAPLLGTALWRRTGAVKKPVMQPGDLGLEKAAMFED